MLNDYIQQQNQKNDIFSYYCHQILFLGSTDNHGSRHLPIDWLITSALGGLLGEEKTASTQTTK